MPDVLEVTAKTWEDEIMGVRHRSTCVVEGVQFHPESIMTAAGKQLLPTSSSWRHGEAG